MFTIILPDSFPLSLAWFLFFFFSSFYSVKAWFRMRFVFRLFSTWHCIWGMKWRGRERVLFLQGSRVIPKLSLTSCLVTLALTWSAGDVPWWDAVRSVINIPRCRYCCCCQPPPLHRLPRWCHAAVAPRDSQKSHYPPRLTDRRRERERELALWGPWDPRAHRFELWSEWKLGVHWG